MSSARSVKVNEAMRSSKIRAIIDGEPAPSMRQGRGFAAQSISLASLLVQSLFDSVDYGAQCA
jgi:hypothetical protein